MTDEVWKDLGEIEGFEKYSGYQVSDHGRVRNPRNNILSQYCNTAGYLVTIIHHRGTPKGVPVHRLVAAAYIPHFDPTKKVVSHIDGNRENNHVSNLEWRSHSKCHYSVLTDRDIIEIYALLRSRALSQDGIAKRYNVSIGMVRDIQYGRTWTHITGPLGGPIIYQCTKKASSGAAILVQDNLPAIKKKEIIADPLKVYNCKEVLNNF
jgi:DNA-binding transcriptional regulator YiaG